MLEIHSFNHPLYSDIKSETYGDNRDFNIIDDYTPLNRYLLLCEVLKSCLHYKCAL